MSVDVYAARFLTYFPVDDLGTAAMTTGLVSTKCLTHVSDVPHRIARGVCLVLCVLQNLYTALLTVHLQKSIGTAVTT